MISYLVSQYNLKLSADKEFARTIYHLTGLRPVGLEVYRLAFKHSSMANHDKPLAPQCNERLEMLGDSILDSIVAQFLFNRYPNRGEGFLTEMRAKMVSRDALNDVGNQMGLCDLLEYQKSGFTLNHNIAGNTFEALVGAVNIDKGIEAARKFVVNKVINIYYDLDTLESLDRNFKSQIIRQAHQQGLQTPVFVTEKEEMHNEMLIYFVACKIGNRVMGRGSDRNRKNAEQKAAEGAVERLLIDLQNAKKGKSENKKLFGPDLGEAVAV